MVRYPKGMADFQKPSNTEDEYFAREEIEHKRKLAFEQHRALEEKQRQELKKLHWMKCPKCGMDLHTLSKGSVEVDTCFNCGGVFLDAGEMEQIIAEGHKHSHAVMEAVLNFVRHKK